MNSEMKRIEKWVKWEKVVSMNSQKSGKFVCLSSVTTWNGLLVGPYSASHCGSDWLVNVPLSLRSPVRQLVEMKLMI